MIVLLALIIVICAIITYFQQMWKIYSYWKTKNIVGPTPYPIVGNYGSVIFQRECEADFLRRIYEQYPNEQFIGLYKGIRPVLVIRDPDYMKCVLVSDFNHFSDRCLEKPFLTLNKSLFIMSGNHLWQATRQSLLPFFSKSKLAKMLPLISHATDEYLDYVNNLVKNKIDNEICGLQSKYIAKVIGNTMFGMDIKAFEDVKSDRLRSAIHTFLEIKLDASTIYTMSYTCPLIVDILTPLILQQYIKRLHSKLHQLIASLIYEPKSNENVIKTFLDILINLKDNNKENKNGKVKLEMDDEAIVQQIMAFAGASYVSMSVTMVFMIYELALHQDIQERCYEEIKIVFKKNNGELTSESLSYLKYLEMTLEESSRLHSSVHYLERKCVSKYMFPNTNFTIDKDIYVFYPVHGLHKDPKYFPNPNVFDPERFSSENKSKIRPYVYMPFGEGPRKCIGERLAKTCVILGMARFLQRFRVTPSSKTKTKLQYNPARLLTALDGVWVNIEPRF